MIKRIKRFITPSRTSPKGSRRACLCEDNTYSIKCCDGSLRGQGIGKVQPKIQIKFKTRYINYESDRNSK